jgi:hypothetical protein
MLKGQRHQNVLERVFVFYGAIFLTSFSLSCTVYSIQKNSRTKSHEFFILHTRHNNHMCKCVVPYRTDSRLAHCSIGYNFFFFLKGVSRPENESKIEFRGTFIYTFFAFQSRSLRFEKSENVT